MWETAVIELAGSIGGRFVCLLRAMPEDSTHKPELSLREIIRPGLVVFRAYWKIFCAIQTAALLFVIAYYNMTTVQNGVHWLGEIKARLGVIFAAFGTMCTGAIIPEIIKLKFRPAGVPLVTLGGFGFRCLMMALVGVNVFYFYIFQDFLFGSGTDVSTLLKKMLFDQLIFTPVFAMPFIATCFIFYEERFNLFAAFKRFNLQTYRTRVLPLWVMALSFWPVMLLFVYSMPSELQFVIFLFANSAWSLMMILVASNRWKQVKRTANISPQGERR